MGIHRKTLIIGSRESLLAVRQSEIVMEYLAENCPGLHCELKTMKTTGDRIMGRLDRIGGKGLFVKELDQALRSGRIDLSVHSLKDMPMETPPDLPVIGFSVREDPRDVLVLPAEAAGAAEMAGTAGQKGITGAAGTAEKAGTAGQEGITGAAETAGPAETGCSLRGREKTKDGNCAGVKTGQLSLEELSRKLDLSKPVGTSSRRRALQLRRLFSEICPQIRFESVRGNVQTRLRKLDEGQYSALVLAAAGLHRLHLEERISRYFEVDEIIPSAGQGILALQGRAGEDYTCLDSFTSTGSALAAEAERSFVRSLGGGCTSPIAAYASLHDGVLTLLGFYYDDVLGKDIRRSLTKRISTVQDCRGAGAELAALVSAAVNQ